MALTDVLRARSRFQQLECGRRLIAVGFGATKRKFRVCRVEPCDESAGGHTIAFRNGHLDQSSADLWRDANVSGFDISGRASCVLLAATATRRCGDDGDTNYRPPQPKIDPHAVRPSKAINARRCD